MNIPCVFGSLHCLHPADPTAEGQYLRRLLGVPGCTRGTPGGIVGGGQGEGGGSGTKKLCTKNGPTRFSQL